jgi:protein translocase SEC61 complex gamma subunit
MVDIVGSSWKAQNRVEEWVRRRRRTGWLSKVREIFKIARRPTSEDFVKTCQITGIGLFLIGLLGFGIYLIWVALLG